MRNKTVAFLFIIYHPTWIFIPITNIWQAKYSGMIVDYEA